MAGHNKWSKVKHVKGAADARRGRIFSKLSREIIVSAREGGGDVSMNARLRQAVAAAKAQNMPNDTIDRAIKRGTGELGGGALEEVVYEGFGAGGAAVIVEVLTDNKNRSAADIRSIFNKNDGNMGSSGSVAFMFERRGEIRISAEALTEEAALEAALEAGAEDVRLDDDEHVILTAVDQLAKVGAALREKDLPVSSQQLVYIPQTTVSVDDRSSASKVMRLYEALDHYDDTQNVFANFDIPDDVLEELETAAAS